MRIIVALIQLLCVFGFVQAIGQDVVYQEYLNERLPLLGHRNWIVIADSAYPAQTAAGIETVYTGSKHRPVLAYVLESVAKAPHVHPIVLVDKELEYVDERDAEGIERYRQDLKELLRDHKPQSMPHEDIIATLDDKCC